MSVNEYKLETFKRESTNTSGLKNLRKEGKIPGIFYSHDSADSIPFYIEKNEIHNIQKSGARLFQISVNEELKTVIFKDVQFHPVTDEILHIDLYGVRMDEKIQINVPLNLIGIPVGVKTDGGQLTQPMTEIEVQCLPGDIPEFVEYDVTEMKINDNLHAIDLEMPEKIELITNPDSVVAMVSMAVQIVEEEEVSEDEDTEFEEEGSDTESESKSE